MKRRQSDRSSTNQCWHCRFSRDQAGSSYDFRWEYRGGVVSGGNGNTTSNRSGCKRTVRHYDRTSKRRRQKSESSQSDETGGFLHYWRSSLPFLRMIIKQKQHQHQPVMEIRSSSPNSATSVASFVEHIVRKAVNGKPLYQPGMLLFFYRYRQSNKMSFYLFLF